MRPENEWFAPERLARLLAVQTGIAAVAMLAVVAFVAFVAPPEVGVVAVALWIVVFGFLAWWIRAFADSAAYRLSADDLQYRRGVWFRKQSSVPYDRITNVDTNEGPIQRLVGVGSVSVQTAGYAAQAGAELKIDGIADYEDVKEQILAKVRERRPVATEGAPNGARPPTAMEGTDPVLAELRRIRELLEVQGRPRQ